MSPPSDRATWPLAFGLAMALLALGALASSSLVAAVPPLAMLWVAQTGGSRRLLVNLAGAFALLGAGLLAIAGLA